MNWIANHWNQFKEEGDWFFGGIAWAILLGSVVWSLL